MRIVRAMVLGTGLAWFAVIDHTPAIDLHRIVPPLGGQVQPLDKLPSVGVHPHFPTDVSFRDQTRLETSFKFFDGAAGGDDG